MTSHRSSAAMQGASRERHIGALLATGDLPDEAVDAVVDAGLAAYALEKVAQGGAAADPRLRRARLTALARHVAMRSAAAGLVRGWHEAGIESLLFKGFALAEFVYPDASWRAYSDVDVCLRDAAGSAPAELADRAAVVARERGFRVVWRLGQAADASAHHDGAYDGHELLQLVHEGTGISVDAHRRLVHSNVNLRRQGGRAERITAAVWSASTAASLDGVPVRLPAPADAALVGLMAARTWSSDRHVLRPHDLLDLRALMERGLDRAALLARADELGMRATARLFLRRCDPASGRVDLSVPGPVRLFWYDTLLAGEHGHRGLAQAGAVAAAAPRRWLAVLRELPAAWRGLARLRTGRGVAWAADVGHAGRDLDRRTWRTTQLGVRRALRLLGSAPETEPVLAVALVHGSLARRGYRVVARHDGDARVEHDGVALPLDTLGVVVRAARQGAHVDGEAGATPVVADAPRVSPASPPRLPLLGRLRAAGWRGLAWRLEALLLLRHIRASLRTDTFQEVRSRLLGPGATATQRGAHARRASAASAAGGDAAALGRAVESAARYVPGALCVAQSLAGQVMLARRGEASTIHMGFLRHPGAGVQGHAWLEVDGAVVVGDGALDSFTRTAVFESAGARHHLDGGSAVPREVGALHDE